MADFTGLEWAFQVPGEITDEEIKSGYQALRLRLEMEIAQMPITTTAAVRAERILSFYCRLKAAEKAGYGSDEGFGSPAEEKEVNMFLKALLKDWDDVIIRSKPTGQEAAIRVERQFKQIFVDVVGSVDMPPAIRNDLMERLNHTVVMAGLDHG
jgi:hypothetical protein